MTDHYNPDPEVIKLFFCATPLSMKFVLLLTIANPFFLNIAEHENFSANKYENDCWHLKMIVGTLIFISRENFMLG